MYKTIEEIQQGDNPWKSTPFHYNGPMPKTLPKWMTKEYVLVMHYICPLLCKQIVCTDFDGHWDYVPFVAFNHNGNQVWTDIMSRDWAAKQVVHDYIYICLHLNQCCTCQPDNVSYMS